MQNTKRSSKLTLYPNPLQVTQVMFTAFRFWAHVHSYPQFYIFIVLFIISISEERERQNKLG